MMVVMVVMMMMMTMTWSGRNGVLRSQVKGESSPIDFLEK